MNYVSHGQRVADRVFLSAHEYDLLMGALRSDTNPVRKLTDLLVVDDEEAIMASGCTPLTPAARNVLLNKLQVMSITAEQLSASPLEECRVMGDRVGRAVEEMRRALRP